ncbi:MAG: AgmX/PglI C-terminal domain-containing protein [Bradymonadaceae bacterium]
MSSQPGQKILRIGLIQNGKILEERLLRSPQVVTVGHALKKNTFVVPVSNLPKSLTVFDVSGGRYVLQFTDKMSGRLSLGDGVETLADLVKKGRAKRSGAGYSLPLPPNARGKIVIGEVTLLFQFVTPPPVRPKPVLPASMRGGWIKGVEPVMATLLIASAFVQIAFVSWLVLQDWPQPLDFEYEFPDRMVRILAEPDEEEPPEIETEPLELDDDGDVPVEAEAEPEATKSDDTPEEIAEQRQRERTMQEVEDKTLLRVLGAKGEDGSIVDTLLNGVGDISAEDAFANSTGVQHAEAGVERSGLKGRGSPDADGVGARAGIDDLGSLKGADKKVDIGKREEQQVKSRPLKIQNPDEMVGGTLDSGSISQAIRRRQSAIQNCFERELRRNHQAGGRVVINFTITARGSRGAVSQARAVVDDVGGGVGPCVANEISNLRGLPAPDGGDVIINMPFVFQAAQ